MDLMRLPNEEGSIELSSSLNGTSRDVRDWCAVAVLYEIRIRNPKADCEVIRNYIPLLSKHRHMRRSRNTKK